MDVPQDRTRSAAIRGDESRQGGFDAAPDRAGRPGLAQVRDVVCPECRSFLGPMTRQRCCPECGAALRDSAGWVGLDRGRRWLQDRGRRLAVRLRQAGLDLPLAAAGTAAIAAVLMVTVHELIRTSLVAMLLNPLIEEALKVAFLVAVVETRPTRITRARDLALVAMIGALAYSSVGNAVEVYLFRPELGMEMALPWLASVLLHMGCTAVATLGVIWAWRTMRAGQPGTRWALAAAVPTLVLAAIIRQVGVNAGMLGMFN